MKTKLSTLIPQKLWQQFYAISQIPHPSGSTYQIKKYIVDFAKELGLETKTDKAGNICIKKPASKHYEQRPRVILQAHMDMVPQKNKDVIHDFEKDPLQLQMEGDWLSAVDTTLGADNGIGLAAILAVLESKTIKHGPIVALITNDEEIGMNGAFGLNANFLKGHVLINLDSEDEGELFIGCAGGIDADFTFHYSSVPTPSQDIALELTIGGLLGGHSGIDIHLERANANKLLFRFLKIAIAEYGARLSSYNGGSLRNAIPREASAVITVPEDIVDEIKELIDETGVLFNEEFAGIEKKISIQVEKVNTPKQLLPEEVQDDLVNAITACPNGVVRHLPTMKNVVETSSNLASIRTLKDKIEVKCLLRSASESRKFELCSVHDSIFSLAGAKVNFSSPYPGWQLQTNAKILKIMENVYKELFGKKPVKKVIHAGLECGIFSALNSDLEIISFGPTINFPHSPDEKVHIPSVKKFWDFLLATLKSDQLKQF